MKTRQLTKLKQASPPFDLQTNYNISSGWIEFDCRAKQVPLLCDWLFNQQGYHFVGLVVEENTSHWDLNYLFVNPIETELIRVHTNATFEQAQFSSVSVPVHAADWHEREAEDLFGLDFDGHPHLGDFILHNDTWPEGVEPMRNGFNQTSALHEQLEEFAGHPKKIVTAPGSFIMPIGPIFSGEAESVHFQLETIGEEIFRVTPRLFFKYRGVEKTAEGLPVNQALLLAERFAGSTAFSHALAFCLATEKIQGIKAPERAETLRVFLAELERFRHHLGVIEGICNSTGLIVAANQVAILEEKALRLSGSLTGHRYLFGLIVPGGLSRDFSDSSLHAVVEGVSNLVYHLKDIENLLYKTSSFLDRIEEVGNISEKQARDHGLVGPVARGSGHCNDIRQIQPYCSYDTFNFTVPREQEGDGYARLRIFFAELKQSHRIMKQVIEMLSSASNTPVAVPCETKNSGVAIAGVETPRGGSWHWLRIDENGIIKRYHIITPSFANWHGFHIAAENFAFQDFPIIMATFGLSVAENDR